MIFGIADDNDATSAGLDLGVFGNAHGSVVRSLGMKVGTNFANERAHVFLGEYDDRIDIGERGKNFGALFGGHERASRAF